MVIRHAGGVQHIFNTFEHISTHSIQHIQQRGQRAGSSCLLRSGVGKRGRAWLLLLQSGGKLGCQQEFPGGIGRCSCCNALHVSDLTGCRSSCKECVRARQARGKCVLQEGGGRGGGSSTRGGELLQKHGAIRIVHLAASIDVIRCLHSEVAGGTFGCSPTTAPSAENVKAFTDSKRVKCTTEQQAGLPWATKSFVNLKLFFVVSAFLNIGQFCTQVRIEKWREERVWHGQHPTIIEVIILIGIRFIMSLRVKKLGDVINVVALNIRHSLGGQGLLRRGGGNNRCEEKKGNKSRHELHRLLMSWNGLDRILNEQKLLSKPSSTDYSSQ